MATNKIDLILHALSGIRAQLIAYHQMRTQAVVFICGLAVAASGFTLTRRDEPRWLWVALVGPFTFLLIALFLSTYFRKLIDSCQEIENRLHDELFSSMNTPSSSGPALEADSAVRYHLELRKINSLKKWRILKPLWSDGPQLAILSYMIFYLVFWFWWFKPWK